MVVVVVVVESVSVTLWIFTGSWIGRYGPSWHPLFIATAAMANSISYA